ncbi:UTP-hexose-1-phosphate uridylyltransferase [Amphibacillus marinus]|uniref:Galactose-1-phosphate uridylyltransferase n=1 Tax=Amphibacillus marinus TaxID=872970 RepID=A0A1H8ML85_9BACI|nr:UDP-glucose--hexose-1-phosphate uridylyltransferase [Amphibacillus marinus]SEO17896.1 UTP-hexose-1-phosphate uridylyltransferase [Amphibacillus marinus]
MIEQSIEQLINKSIEAGLIEERDRIYSRNQLIGLLKLDSFTEPNTLQSEASIPELLNQLINYAVEHSVIDSALDDREKLDAQLMNVFLSKPSEINHTFSRLYMQDPKKATNYFYHMSQVSHYIQTERIAKNIHYQAETAYGKLDITINLSKPEKDPEQIKRERQLKQAVKYPQCLLCRENEGYVGRTGHPARSNHRIIDLELDKEAWFFQYSPYVYYNEHSIVFAKDHRPMVIAKKTFKRLLDFVAQFPHYFIGSNADLPIVGGSILSHDHYQAGNYTFGMTEAANLFSFELQNYPNIQASVLNWPMSVIRLRHPEQEQLVQAGDAILQSWRNYSDEEVAIRAYSDDTPHNTITPIARYRDGYFELDLVLRNNRTNKAHPDGIFHPHQDVHHIKKENIGLIEVMGLAVLPPRLKPELDQVSAYLTEQSDSIADYHQAWADQLRAETDITPENVQGVIEEALAKKFTRVLEDSGVFKLNIEGEAAFKRFISFLNS